MLEFLLILNSLLLGFDAFHTASILKKHGVESELVPFTRAVTTRFGINGGLALMAGVATLGHLGMYWAGLQGVLAYVAGYRTLLFLLQLRSRLAVQ